MFHVLLFRFLVLHCVQNSVCVFLVWLCSGVTKPSLLVFLFPILSYILYFLISLFLCFHSFISFCLFSQCQAFDLTTINDSHDFFVSFFVFFLFSFSRRLFVFAGFFFTNIIQS